MTLEDIIADWLKEHGYDGLCDPEITCGCTLESGLCPCDLPDLRSCRAGHNDPERAKEVGTEYWVVEGKKG